VRRHLIIPDTQIRPGVPTEHIDWAARAIVEYLPDVVIHLGDHWDFASLNSHSEKGSEELEGRRYQDDLDTGNDAFARLNAPMAAEIARRHRRHIKRWTPRKVFLRGNHEHRADRIAKNDPKWQGIIGSHNCQTLDWEVVPFLQVAVIDGIRYSHYFQNVNSSKSIGGSIDNRLNRIGESFVQGHEQGFLYGNRTFPTGRVKHGLVCGSYYLHDEGYKGAQGNGHWRGIVVLNEVQDGAYDIMPLSIEYLRRKYG
jgi:hypothetical protein